MRLLRSLRFLLFVVCIWSGSSFAAGKQVLHGHVPAVMKALAPIGAVPATNQLQLAIGLPIRNQKALTELLRQIYDPTSTNYHRYLTPNQFTDKFGPAESDYRAVLAFASAHGLEVTATHPNRMIVDVRGTVQEVERAFKVRMRRYQHPTERRTFHAPANEPSVDLEVPILRIDGLDNFSLPQPAVNATLITNQHAASPSAGTGPSGLYLGVDLRRAYFPDSYVSGRSLIGSGQSVGLVQFDGYNPADIVFYERMAGYPVVTVTNVPLHGFNGQPSLSGGDIEVCLDIEMALAMAPGLSRIIVYQAPQGSPWVDIFSRMANDNAAKQLSCSWFSTFDATNAVVDQLFQQMAVQGQSFFEASGDNDAFIGKIPFPQDNPYITIVGGTTLTTGGTNGAWLSEIVWNQGSGLGTGGGISMQYPIPAWQQAINMPARQGSSTMRNIPDVAAVAQQIYVRARGNGYSVSGTSCSAPLWAGFMALVNQQAAALGKPPAGFINPAVYTIAGGPGYGAAFHDVTVGDNTSGNSPTKFLAVPGYDLCTGVGTPVGQALVDALVGPVAP